MAKPYLPSRESELVVWMQNFAGQVTEDPARYGLTEAQGTQLGTLNTNFQQNYDLANHPQTRSPTNIEAKNVAKRELIAYTRQLVEVIQGQPSTTDTQRRTLGITVRDSDPTPVPPPEVAPRLDVVSVSGWLVSLRLHDGESTRRAKPAGVKGATLFSYVGETPPSDIAAWKFEGSTTRTSTQVMFSNQLTPGTKVWLTAFWFNPRLESGPACAPVGTQINYGGFAAAA
jgi:hypothetical protein